MWRERAIVRKVLKRIGLTKGDRVLDIPCGTGVLGETLGKFLCNVVASDISREMIDLAREDYENSNFGGFVQADVTKMSFRKGTFKCVITIGLIHRLPEDIRGRLWQPLPSYLEDS